MQVNDVVKMLSLHVSAGEAGIDREVRGGYTADLLSCAMASADAGDIWVTLQGHVNVVAVASLKELAAVIVAEDKPVAPDTLAKADAERIPILTTPLSCFEVVGRLWEIGVRA